MRDRPWYASYQDGVPRTLTYPHATLYDILRASAERFPRSPAIAFWLPGAPLRTTISYARLLHDVDRFSYGLAGLGVRSGDRVGLVMPNCPQYVIAYYATQRLGAVVVGNNPTYTERELAHQLLDAGVDVVVTIDLLYPKVAAVREEVGLREVIVGRLGDFAPVLVRPFLGRALAAEARRAGTPWPPVPQDARVRTWREVMGRGDPPVPPAEVDPDEDVAGFIYTGGTTGPAKGAMLTHRNLVANALQGAAWFPDLAEGRESVMCIVPFFHAYGMTVAMNFGICKAAKLVVLPRFDQPTALRAIEKERPGLLPGIPRLYAALVEAAEGGRHDLTSIRACVSGAAPLPATIAEAFERLTGGALVEGYGLTETSPITHGNPLRGRRKAGSIGIPLPDTDCMVVDPADWTIPVPPGDQGELAVSGPQVMKGYHGRAEETAAILRTDADGRRWLLTGDIARMDEDGFVFLVDRKKDVINVSGFKVFPTEVEQVLYRHPAVERVCVAGVPDARTGEAVKAYVVLRAGSSATEAELEAFCADPVNGLAGFRVPRLVEFRESLPETLVGKVLRRALREEEERRLAHR